MHLNEIDPLLEAVMALTTERHVPTTIIDEATGVWLDVHVEVHAPLITMLEHGTGAMSGAGSGSSDPGVPVDADALEIWGQVRDLIRVWCNAVGAQFDRDDLIKSVVRWYLGHMNAYSAQKINDGTHHDVTRMVQGWVRMIESKFDPDKKIEWTDPCPAYLSFPDPDGEHVVVRRCGARRVMVNDVERFAIQVNITKAHAECVRCGAVWEGGSGLVDLRNQSIDYAKELAERADT